jgi:DNA repair protein RadC
MQTFIFKLCHNHPSGNCNPSSQDNSTTKKIKDACTIMDITVLDHLIITSENYYSYADEGKI